MVKMTIRWLVNHGEMTVSKVERQALGVVILRHGRGLKLG